MNQETKPEQPEIKAGQTLVHDNGQDFVDILWCDSKDALVRWHYNKSLEIVTIYIIRRCFKPKPSPTTRPITWEDVRKLLAENPILFYRVCDDESDSWDLITDSDEFCGGQMNRFEFTRNPFLDNPIILGPTVVEGEV